MMSSEVRRYHEVEANLWPQSRIRKLVATGSPTKTPPRLWINQRVMTMTKAYKDKDTQRQKQIGSCPTKRPPRAHNQTNIPDRTGHPDPGRLVNCARLGI